MTLSARLVIVLDDEEVVRTSLSRLLQANGYRVRNHASPQEFFDAGMPGEPACLLLDQRLASAVGTEVHAEMRRRGWELPTIFLTADWDTRTVVKAMRSGADNYLTKPFNPEELIEAVEEACERSCQFFLRGGDDAALRRRALLLTPRERTIVSLAVKGRLNKEIAAQLQLALVTVKLHRGRAMRKLGAQNVADLTRIAVKIGL
jgi:FixJ family two-component response regulator